MKILFIFYLMLVSLPVFAQEEIGHKILMNHARELSQQSLTLSIENVRRKIAQDGFEKILKNIINPSEPSRNEDITQLELCLKWGANPNTRDSSGYTSLARVMQVIGSNKIDSEYAFTLVKILTENGASVAAIQDPETGKILFEENIWKIMKGEESATANSILSLYFSLSRKLALVKVGINSYFCWVYICDGGNSYKKAALAKEMLTILRKAEYKDKEDIVKLLDHEGLRDVSTIIMKFVGKNALSDIRLVHSYTTFS